MDDLGVDPGDVVVDPELLDEGVPEELVELGFVSSSMRSPTKPGAKLPQSDRGQPDPVGLVDEVDHGVIAATKPAVRRSVEAVAAQRQSSWSISS